MSDSRIRPRIEFEEAPAPRLDFDPLPVGVAPTGSVMPESGTVSTILTGIAVLVLGMALLQTLNFVIAQFDRSFVLGCVTLVVGVVGFGLIGSGVRRELRGLLGLRVVDRLREQLADPMQARQAALEWLATLPEGPLLAEAVRGANDPQTIPALLRAGPLKALRERSEALGRAAALQIFAITAAVPSPALDGVLVGWRGARLVRQVAELHGLRPGLFGTLSLLRRTAMAAGAATATNLAVDTVTRSLLSNSIVGHLAGDVAGAGVAARRMVVLARAAATACSPLDPA